MDFVHLHVHTYYSILDGESSIKSLFKMADKYNQSALAITDHGNMFGVKDFLKVAEKFPNIKPIIGCEVYVNPEGRFTKRGREDQGAYHLILLAKNLEGYYNLVKIVSTGWVEGLYYKPKVDREILERYHSNIICSSACLGGEIPSLIRKGDLKGAEEAALWYKNLFGEDYYLEVQLHKTEVPGMSLDTYEKQLIVNKEIFSLSERLGIKCIATNDVHFASKEDGPAHDRLICLTTNALLSDTKRMRYTQQRHDQIALVFPILIIGYQHHFTSLNSRNGLLNRIIFKIHSFHLTQSRSPAAYSYLKCPFCLLAFDSKSACVPHIYPKYPFPDSRCRPLFSSPELFPWPYGV